MTVPDGSRVQTASGPEITVTDGGVLSGDGSLSFPGGGSVRIGDTTVTVPERGTITPGKDGTVEVPPGSKITDRNGKVSTVPSQGGTLDEQGDYTDNKTADPPGGGGSGGGSSGGGSSGGGSSGGGSSGTASGKEKKTPPEEGKTSSVLRVKRSRHFAF